MKLLLMLVSLVIMSGEAPNVDTKHAKEMDNRKITFISFLYFNQDGQEKLEEFQMKAKPYFEKYGIEILHQYKPVGKGQIGINQNNIEQPDMIQIFTATSMENFQAYMADELVKQLAAIRNAGLRKMNASFGMEIETEGIITPSANNAVHGIALVTFNNANGYDQLLDFNRRGQQSGLFTKYGIHAESFLKVMKSMPAIGVLDYSQPEGIIIFGVDDPSRMKDYVTDNEYLKLAPVRDNTLNSYHFFMCK